MSASNHRVKTRRKEVAVPLIFQHPQLVAWMIKWFYPTVDRNTAKVLSHVYETIERWLRTRGPLETARRCKISRLVILRILGDKPLSSPTGIALTRSGIPKPAKALQRQILDKDLPTISALLSIYSISRALMGGSPVDETPIIEKWRGEIPEDVLSSIPNFLSRYQIGPFDPSWTGFHYSVKAGPQGPAMLSSLIDAIGLTDRQQELISLIGGEALAERLAFWRKWKTSTAYIVTLSSALGMTAKALKKVSGVTAKLSVRKDRETKSRIFGILDYWTQTCLFPIHVALFKALKRIGSDQTFDQTRGLALLRPDKGSQYHSIDLSNATDRFPVELQKAVLSHLIGPEKSAAWAELLTDRDYILKGVPLRYGAGQPMGAYSSWASFSLCHHLIVYVAGVRAGMPRFSNYRILGDDIVIANDTVAQHYCNIMERLGCSFSEAKTHRSKDLFEFAKRLFYNGEEFSPFPLAGLLEVTRRYHLLSEFLDQLERRGFVLPRLYGDPGLIAELLKILGVGPRKRDNILRHLEAFRCLPRGSKIDLEGAGESFFKLSRFFGFTLSCNIPYHRAGELLSDTMRLAYHMTMERTAKKSLAQIELWNKKLVATLQSMPKGFLGIDDQSSFASLVKKNAPPLRVLCDEVERSFGELLFTHRAKGPSHLWVWDKTQSTKLRILPTGQGITPLRSSYQLAGSRAAFAKGLKVLLTSSRQKALSR